ncbi:hypothetical protein K438DRAFT_1770329 [Mycena galopus ATCC 62051]|nr:hypothetical protein K438DRAFT_1770329 [Mycena galopus ATCC 62051]
MYYSSVFLFFSTRSRPKVSAGFLVGGTYNVLDVEISRTVFNLNNVNSSPRENKHRLEVRKPADPQLSISRLEKLEKMWTNRACTGMRGVGIGDESPSVNGLLPKAKSNVENVRAEQLVVKIFSTHDVEGISPSEYVGFMHDDDPSATGAVERKRED